MHLVAKYRWFPYTVSSEDRQERLMAWFSGIRKGMKLTSVAA
ncbi:hypothetical protein ADIS_4822 [Lunatimonas lonarensis]|uniref:Uncharacterized protein n=1 Tax=Lunatimonas lonarensis TaxID=1232681 RepID=R7ZKT4_9BACT|nr:hypothetical protein ADIS_4822 [Lunatimonas lonarensis]